MEERKSLSSKSAPLFSCYQFGAIRLPNETSFPPALERLLCAVTSCGKHTTESDAFHTAICHYNNAFSFTLLGADLDQPLLQVTGTGHYAFRAHG